MTEVSVRELKSRLSEYLHRLEQGERITVTRRGKPVGVMIPVAGPQESDAQRLRQKLEELKARGIISHIGEGKPKVPRKTIKLIGEGPAISEMVLEDRG